MKSYYEYSTYDGEWYPNNESFKLRDAEMLVMQNQPNYPREELKQRAESVKNLIMGVEVRVLPVVEVTTPYITQEDLERIKAEYEKKLAQQEANFKQKFISRDESVEKAREEMRVDFQHEIQEKERTIKADFTAQLIAKDAEIGELKTQLEELKNAPTEGHAHAVVSLSDEFPSKIRKNPIACRMITVILKEVVEPLVEKRKKWTWGHVMYGMNAAKVSNMNGAEFGRAINSVFPNLKADNVERSVRGYEGKTKQGLSDKDQNIVEQVKTILEMVHEMSEVKNPTPSVNQVG